VTLDEAGCWVRLESARHGVLGTAHARRGVDAVPVVFAIAGGRLIVPVDTIKAKRARPLQRLRNLERDSRCVLLVDEYDDDWSRLWWVRVHGQGVETAPTAEMVDLLAERYPQYRLGGSVTAVVVVSPSEITGWTA